MKKINNHHHLDKSPTMRSYLAQMCEKFTDSFKKIKELRSMRNSLENENVQINKILLEENEKLDLTLAKLKDDLSQLQEKRDNLIKKSNECQTNNLMLSKEKLQKEKIYQNISMQYDSEKNKNTKILTESFVVEIANLKEKLIEMKRISKKLEEKEEQMKEHMKKLRESKESNEGSLKELEGSLKEIEKSSMEKTFQDHELTSTYRKNLKENREKLELIEKTEKNLDIISIELESKLERLRTIIASNKVLKGKIIKNEDNICVYQLINNENNGLKKEVAGIKAKIESIGGNNFKKTRSNTKALDMTLQKEKNKELKEKIEKLTKVTEEKESAFRDLKRINAILNEKKQDLKVESEVEQQKNRQLQENYSQLNDKLEKIRGKLGF